MRLKKQIIACIVCAALLAGLIQALQAPSAVQAGPLPQDTRPPAGGSGSDDDDGGDDEEGPSEIRCASLYGQVLNWGFGPQEGVAVELRGGGWQLSATSASDGRYNFGALGVGVATLHVVLAPESPLQPLIQDAAVYLNCDFPIVANVALFSGDERVEPPAAIQMSAESTLLAPGGETDITLTVENGLPNDITNVVVTDLLPQGLTASSVAVGMAEEAARLVTGSDGRQLVVVNLDRLSSGAEETIRVTVAASRELNAEAGLRNLATLFYNESAADQAWVDFEVVGQAVPLPATAPTETPVPADEFVPPAETVTPEPTATVAPSPSPEPTGEATGESVDEEFMPPPADMPTTGNDLAPPGALPVTGNDSTALSIQTGRRAGVGVIVPLGFLGLGILAGLAHQLRFRHRNRE